MDANESDTIGRLTAVFGGEPKPEPAAPVAPVAEETTEDQAADQPEVAEEAPEESEAVPAVEEVEIEVENWRGKIPAKLKAELDKAKDYTRKTQEVAEQKRMVETERRLFQEQQAFQTAVSEEAAQLRAIDSQLAAFRNVDLSVIDTDQLARMQMTAAALREDKARLQESLQQKQGQFKKRVYESWDEMTESARKVITKEIPDWDTNAQKIAEHALSMGFPFEVITGYDRQTRERVSPGVTDPVFAKALYKAWKWDQLQAGKIAAVQSANKAPPVVKPGAATNNTQAAQKEDKALRQRVKQTGNISDVARLLASRMR